jgi:hypothetical protein
LASEGGIDALVRTAHTDVVQIPYAQMRAYGSDEHECDECSGLQPSDGLRRGIRRKLRRIHRGLFLPVLD